LIYSTLNTNKKLNEDVLTIYNPSLSGFAGIAFVNKQFANVSKELVFIEKQSETPD
jgi:hypothetical protein